ncbi:nuclear valosin-containing protein-like isoform X2 [Cephus cinctus]|nr:nuclear valosin-containing protein-like isoform X2 [Cephus cinctus]
MVRKAYDEISRNYERKSTVMEHYDDNDDYEPNSHRMDTRFNNQMVQIYKKGNPNGNSCDREVVDISGDDDPSDTEVVASKKPWELPMLSNESQKKSVKEVTTFPLPPPTPSPVEKQIKKRLRVEDGDSPQFSIKKRKREVLVTEAKIKFENIAGCAKVLETICKLLVHIKHPEVFKQLGISSPRGFLLHGPPGCGKTLLGYAIAGELEIPLLKVAGPELVGGISGESEARIRELFDQAIAIAPCVLFLDEIDTLAPHRANAQREMERRIVAQLLSCMDELSLKENGDRVLVVGATNSPDFLDPALRRAGRFDREVSLGIPDRNSRMEILKLHTQALALAGDVNLAKISELTPGFVGADLVSLIREAAIFAVNRIFEDLQKKDTEDKISIEVEETTVINDKGNVEDIENEVICTPASPIPSTSVQSHITLDDDDDMIDNNVKAESNSMKTDNTPIDTPVDELSGLLTWLREEPPLSPKHLANLFINHKDFEDALHVVQPSAKREGFATVPDVTWDDVGSLGDIRQELQMTILAPVRHSEHFAALGLTTPTGVLLCGPPGCGKTLLAKAIANEAGINFISVKGPELLNMYVGESEKAVRQCFLRARNSAPCVIFFDELDALCPKRSEGDTSATSRVVNQMLTEMDGVEGRKGVFLMAATNRPDIIDPAVLRPGRLDKIIYVGLPTASDRIDILKALTKNGTKPKLADDVSLEDIGNNDKCAGYTGADLAALVRQAGVEALRESMTGPPGSVEVSMRHVNTAFTKVRPSVLKKEIGTYEKFQKTYSTTIKNLEITPMETPAEAGLTDAIVEVMET